jgi:uncharacterized protein YqgC (DUF456 family)
MLMGLVGVVIPVLPDLILVWGAALAHGLILGWGTNGPWLFALITLFAIVGILADLWVSGFSARRRGTSWKAILAGLAAGAVGFVILTPIGGLALLLAATFAVEYMRLRDPRRALRGMFGIGVGYGLAFAVKLVLGLAMIALWILWIALG